SLTVWWRYLHNKLPSRKRMVDRQAHFDTDICPICHQEPETDDHLLVSCPPKWNVWRQFFPSVSP
ncbi:hypothetical protein DM01DRAFT_1266830, partial [Hesseltinella vesiculosa]